MSDDGGATWTSVWLRENDVPGPGQQIADMSFAAGSANVVARFHYQGSFSRWWQVDDVKVGTFACNVLPGGLVVGTVTDANTGAGLAGATVENLTDGGSTTSFAAPGNPGFYSLFADGGPKSFEASLPAYEPLTRSVTVVPSSTTRLDFALPAGLLAAAPRPLQAFVAPGTVQDLTLTLTNTGTGAGSFVIQEVGVPPVASTSSPVSFDPVKRQEARQRMPSERLDDPNQADLPLPAGAPTDAPAIADAGNVVSSFPTGLAFGFGLVYDTGADRLWVANPYYPDFGILGDGLEHQYLPDGTDTGETIDIHDTGGILQADGTYNARTGMLWQVNLGGDSCLFEMDPVAKVVTGNRICGRPTTWDTTSQRAVAYDYATDTYYVGGTNDVVIYHVDSDGNPLDSANVGLSIAGLAYNPTTRHLFLLTQGANPWDVWVLEPHAGYNVPRRLPRDRRRRSGARVRRARPRSRLRRTPLAQHDRRADRLQLRVGRDRMVRERHPVAVGGSGGGHDPGRLAVAAHHGDLRLAGPAPRTSPGFAHLLDRHTAVDPTGSGRFHDVIQRRPAGQLRLELHLRRGRSRRDAGVRPAVADLHVLPRRRRYAAEHGRIHRARRPWSAHAAARLPR